MGTLSVFPLCISYPLRSHESFSQKNHSLNSSLRTHMFSHPIKMAKIGKKSVVFGVNSKDPKESTFRDENGVIDDMDGYLNFLSLEYDSVWDTKPSWCQPWTITLTGILGIGCSWLIFHSILVTTVVSLLVCSWWYIFLYSYPKAYVDMIAERRKRVTSGVEDTYGESQ